MTLQPLLFSLVHSWSIQKGKDSYFPAKYLEETSEMQRNPSGAPGMWFGWPEAPTSAVHTLPQRLDGVFHVAKDSGW